MRVVVGNAWWLLGSLLWAGACAGKQDAAAAGEDCYRDQDCRSGLVCVANAQNNRVCTSDVTSLASTVEAPPPEEVPPAEMPVEDAGTPPEEMPVDDAGTPPEEMPDGG